MLIDFLPQPLLFWEFFTGIVGLAHVAQPVPFASALINWREDANSGNC